MSMTEYVLSEAEVEAGTWFIDARRKWRRMAPLMPLAAGAICGWPLLPLHFAWPGWSTGLALAAVVFFAWWVFGAQGRARGERDVAFAWLLTVRRDDALPLGLILARVENHRHAAD